MKRPHPAGRWKRKLVVFVPFLPKAPRPSASSSRTSGTRTLPPSSRWSRRKWEGSGPGRAEAREGHFRPSPAWPRAGGAHAQLPMELPEFGKRRCPGESEAEATEAGECSTGGELGTGCAGKEGQPRLSFRLSGQGSPRGKPLF